MAQDDDKENTVSAQRRRLLPAPGHSGSPSAMLEDTVSIGRLPNAFITYTKEWLLLLKTQQRGT
jgi:hypothetical protein